MVCLVRHYYKLFQVLHHLTETLSNSLRRIICHAVEAFIPSLKYTFHPGATSG